MIDYAILFSCMGVTILYLAYKNLALSKSNYMHKMLLRHLADGELEIKRTEDGIELIERKEV